MTKNGQKRPKKNLKWRKASSSKRGQKTIRKVRRLDSKTFAFTTLFARKLLYGCVGSASEGWTKGEIHYWLCVWWANLESRMESARGTKSKINTHDDSILPIQFDQPMLFCQRKIIDFIRNICNFLWEKSSF